MEIKLPQVILGRENLVYYKFLLDWSQPSAQNIIFETFLICSVQLITKLLIRRLRPLYLFSKI